MTMGVNGNLQLGAHAIGGSNQNGIFEPSPFRIKKGTESAQTSIGASPRCGFGKGFDCLNQGIACIDIDTRIAVGDAIAHLGYAQVLVMSYFAEAKVRRRLWLLSLYICYKLGRTIRISEWFAMAPAIVSVRNFLRLLSLLAGILMPSLVWAQNVYVATGVPVDVTGDAATLRDLAVTSAQREALKKVLGEITSTDQLAGLQLPSDDEIGSWVSDVEIEEEKITATHYVGRYTIRFATLPIQDFLSAQDIAFAETRAKQMLLIPVYTDETGTTDLWGAANQWMASWVSRPSGNALVPIVVPRGDLDDQNALSATEALGGNQTKLELLAERYQAGDIVVAEAQMSAPTPDGSRSLSLTVTRYGAEGPVKFQDRLTGDAADPDGLMVQAVATVQSMLEGAWKSANMIDPNQRTQISVHVPLTSIEQWVAIKRRLGQVSLIKGVKLDELARSGADLEISYAGDEAQFIRALQQADLTMVSSGEGLATLTLGTGALGAGGAGNGGDGATTTP